MIDFVADDVPVGNGRNFLVFALVPIHYELFAAESVERGCTNRPGLYKRRRLLVYHFLIVSNSVPDSVRDSRSHMSPLEL